MLAHARHVDRLGADLVGELLEDFLGRHHAVFGLGPSDRVLGAQAVEVAPPSGDVGFVVRRGLGDFLGEDRQGGRQVGDDRNISVAVLGDLRSIDVDVHDGRAGREGVEAAGHTVVEAGTERHDEVGALEGTDGGHGTVHAGHAEVVAIRVGEGTAGGQRGDDGGVGDLNELSEGVGGAGADDAAAHVQDGGLGVRDRAGCGAHLLHVRLVRDAVAGQIQGRRPGEVHLGDLRGLGDVHQNGAGATGSREVEGLSQARGDLRGIRDEEGMLGDGH